MPTALAARRRSAATSPESSSSRRSSTRREYQELLRAPPTDHAFDGADPSDIAVRAKVHAVLDPRTALRVQCADVDDRNRMVLRGLPDRLTYLRQPRSIHDAGDRT